MTFISQSFARILFFVALLGLPVPGAAEPASRIVIADGVATEIVYRLGAQDRVVGVDATSTYPPEAKSKAQLGYFRRLSAEGVLALAPDLMIASAHAGPKVALEQIGAAGVPIARMPDVLTLSDIPPKIRALGAALDTEDAAAELSREIEHKIDGIRRDKPEWETAPGILFILTIKDGTPLAAGRGTGPHQVIVEAGGRNVAEFDGYKPMAREALIAAAPDLIVMTDEHSTAFGGVEATLAGPVLQLTPAGQQGHGVTLPALAVMGLGLRTPDAVLTLRAAMERYLRARDGG